MKLIRLLPLAALVTAAAASATPVADWQIIEGYGLTDDYAYLGMTLAEAETRGPPGACATSFGKWACGLLPDPDAPFVYVWFPDDRKDSQAFRIDIYAYGRVINWRTTAGAFAGMPVRQVQALYPGSKRRTEEYGDIVSSAERDVHIYDRARGYDYLHSFYCNTDNGGPLTEDFVQVIFRPGHKPFHSHDDGEGLLAAGGVFERGGPTGTTAWRDGCPSHFPDE